MTLGERKIAAEVKIVRFVVSSAPVTRSGVTEATVLTYQF